MTWKTTDKILAVVLIVLASIIAIMTTYIVGYKHGYKTCHDHYIDRVIDNSDELRRLESETRVRILDRIREAVEKQSAQTGDNITD